MLTLTENAATAVKTIIARGAETETAGLRIYGSDDPAQGFALTVAAAPETSDAIVDESGARVFLDTDAATALDNQVLDAEVDEAGAVHFALAMKR
jgi:Fe-S cluster assembly iron-binding protein IscA